MQSVELTKKVFWVGAEDPDLRVFDIVVKTDYGTTYNSYLLLGEKVALIDAVKEGFEIVFFARIEEHVPLERIDYLIVNHTEPDHSRCDQVTAGTQPQDQACLLQTGGAVSEEDHQRRISADRQASKAATVSIWEGYHSSSSRLHLCTGRTLCLPIVPKRRFFFHATGMRRISPLMNQSSSKPGDKVHEKEAWHYYDAIMRPYASFCRKASQAVIGMDIKIVAPSHGPINRDEPKRFIEKYLEWTAPKPSGDKKRVLIAFASSYGNTRMMAQEIDQTLTGGRPRNHDGGSGSYSREGVARSL